MNNGLQIKEILGLIKTGQISPPEGHRLIQRLKNNRRDDEISQPGGKSLPRVVSGYGAGRVKNSDIAIIGVSGRFPEARNGEQFWENLVRGKSSITEVPKDRWNTDIYYDPDINKPDRTHCKWGSFLADMDKFDALFFQISGREAELSDVQQRLFLEESWNALEDAGYATNTGTKKNCGVFLGIGAGDYQSRMMKDCGPALEAQSFWGNACSVAASRISYFLDLNGPSVAVDTACSSALVAIHLGCQSILTGESDMVVAGGVFVSVTPNFYIMASNAGMLSPRGMCNAFDHRADGFVLGEGVGAIVLKPLGRAVEDRDHIYGVIKSSGINQDGRTNGITAPSTLCQAKLLMSVYEKAGIHPETITYVEAHGTGTKLGDPVEIEALTRAFKKYTDKQQYCAIGSVKTNIGHTFMAAGMASVIKVLFALKHKKIPPLINFEQPNEHINLQNSPFYVNTNLIDWEPPDNQPRRAAVSSFGFSGTNAHLVIEEPPELPRASAGTRPWYFIPLSAKTRDALARKMENLAHWLEREGEKVPLGDIGYTLHMGRSHFNVRCAFVVSGCGDLISSLRAVRQNSQSANYFYHDLKETVSYKPDPTVKELGQQIIDQLINNPLPEEEYREKLRELAGAYVQGVDLNWQGFYPAGHYHRVSLPTYPFVRDRYWFPASMQDAGVQYARVNDEELSDDEILNLLYRMRDGKIGINEANQLMGRVAR